MASPADADGQYADCAWADLLPHRTRALRVARAAGLTQDDAEDCVQDVLIKLATMQDRRAEGLPGLISAATRNRAMDMHRARARRDRVASVLVGRDVAAADHADDIADAIEGQWLLARSHELGSRQRRVLHARIAGLNPAATALHTGLSLKSAEGAYRLARQAVMNMWKATLAALGALLASRRPRATAPAAMALAAVVGIASLLLPGYGALPADGAAPEGGDRPATSPGPLTTPARALSSSPTDRAITALSEPHRPSVGDRVILAPVMIGDEDTGTTVSVRNRAPEENLQQTVSRCLRNGVWLTTTSRRCRDADEPSGWPPVPTGRPTVGS